MQDSLGESLAFVDALGVTVRHVQTGDDCTISDCARYDEFNRIAYLCDSMCAGREPIVVDALIARIT